MSGDALRTAHVMAHMTGQVAGQTTGQAVGQAAGQGRDWIAARIPHQGAMCLLDGVVSADAQRLLCRTRSHLSKPHVLALHGDRLGAACAVEYASQAMALHGTLADSALFDAAAPSTGGRLVSVRQVQLSRPWLDDAPSAGGAPELGVLAEQLAGDVRQASYQFAVGPLNGDELAEVWVSGRASVLLLP